MIIGVNNSPLALVPFSKSTNWDRAGHFIPSMQATHSKLSERSMSIWSSKQPQSLGAMDPNPKVLVEAGQLLHAT